MTRRILETRQAVKAYNHATGRDMRLGDLVEHSGCPVCFHQHTAGSDEALECYRNFPPVPRATVTGNLDCATCGNCMLQDTFLDGRKVIMCPNPHCPDNGTCYHMPTIKLHRLFEP